MGNFVNEPFTAADGTAITALANGVTWKRNSASTNTNPPIIASNRLKANEATQATIYYPDVVPHTADYNVEAVLRAVDVNPFTVILIRCSKTALTGYQVYYDSGEWKLFRVVAGAQTSLATWSNTPSTNDDITVDVGAVTNGSQVDLTVKINGTTRITYSDTNAARITSAGVPALQFYYFVTPGFHVDSFRAYADGTTIDVQDSDIYWSKNWVLDGNACRQTINTGAYCKFKFTGTSVKAKFDVSVLSANSVTSGNYPKVTPYIDGVKQSSQQLTSSTAALTLGSSLSDTQHTLELWFSGIDWNSKDKWNTPVLALRCYGFVLDEGDDISAPNIRSRNILVYADSNGEGWEALGTGVTVANMDATVAFPKLLADELNAELTCVSHAGQGYTGSVATANIPDIVDAWDFYYGTNSRLTGGAFTETFTAIFSMHGQNDGVADVTTDVTALAAAWRTAGPSVPVFFCRPPIGTHASEISAGVTAAADANTFYLNTGAAVISSGHLTEVQHIEYTDLVVAALRDAYPRFFGSDGPGFGIGSGIIGG